MEELFVYSLLCSLGYDEKYDDYKNALDCLFINDMSNEMLLDLEGRAYKDAILHTLAIININDLNIEKMGKILILWVKHELFMVFLMVVLLLQRNLLTII